MIAFVVTFLVGAVTSYVLKAFGLTGSNASQMKLNYNLFFPPIAERLRRKQPKSDDLISQTNNVLNVSVFLIFERPMFTTFFLAGRFIEVVKRAVTNLDLKRRYTACIF